MGTSVYRSQFQALGGRIAGLSHSCGYGGLRSGIPGAMPTRMAGGGGGGGAQPKPDKKSPCDGKDAVTQAAMRLLIANGQREAALSLSNHSSPDFSGKEAKTNNPALFTGAGWKGNQLDSYSSLANVKVDRSAYVSPTISVGKDSYQIKFYPNRDNSVGIIDSSPTGHKLEAVGELLDVALNWWINASFMAAGAGPYPNRSLGTNITSSMHENTAAKINSSLPCN